MLIMGNEFENIRDHLRAYKEDPSDKSWSYLERRLDQDRGKIQLSRMIRYFSIAASIILLFSLMTWMIIHLGNENRSLEEKLSMVAHSPEFAVYQQVPKINGWYTLHDWSRIYEGDANKHFIGTESQIINQHTPEYLWEKGDSVDQ